MAEERYTIEPVAHIRSDFTEKFGIPRQSGLVDGLTADIVFVPACRDPEALRGIEGYSHLWLIWQFSAAVNGGWRPTVRPPRLGGNVHMGVFATRSPYRPNALGLSSVRLLGVTREGPEGPVLHVAGADLLDGTPIYDIKPYLAYVDSHPNARDGFAADVRRHTLRVAFPPALLALLPQEKHTPLMGVLAQDPRPAYQNDPARVYGLTFAGYDVHFTVADDLLTVTAVSPARR